MLRYIVVFSFSFIFSLNLFSQNKGEIKGVVFDSKTDVPVEFATISLFNKVDSILVTGTISDATGIFSIKNISYGSYYMQIAFIGYETLIIDNIVLTNKNSLKDLEKLYLSLNAKVIDEFNVVEEKDIMQTKIDKKVYNVDKDISAQGKMGLEVLKNMPSIDVDEQDNISLRGEESVKILIDGRPSNIEPSQLLKQIPASSIEKIEVITNPSAKYNPEGMAGIINVVLKKEKVSGLNGYTNTGFNYNGQNGFNQSLGLNYKVKKIKVNGGFGYYKGNWRSNNESFREYNQGDTLFYQDRYGKNNGGHNNLWYYGGVDYYVNKKNTLYFSFNGWSGGNSSKSSNTFLFSNENQELDNFSKRNSINESDYAGVNYNVGWQTEFNKEDHILDVDLSYSINSNTSLSNIVDNTYSPQNYLLDVTQLQNTDNDNDNNNLNFKVDYVLPITDSLELEMGILSTIQSQDAVFYSESNDTTNLIYPDVNLNNNFNFNQSVHAFYTTIGKQYKKIGVKLGARLENTILDSELKNTNEKYTQNYFSFFPSAHLSYKIKEGNEYQISYSKRINRPSSWQLNPFTSYSDPYNLSTGNPNLQPEYIDVYELSYIRYWDKVNFNTSVYHRDVNDKQDRITTIVGEGVTVSRPQNLATAKINGGEFTLGYKPYKWWRTNMSFNIWNSSLTSLTFNNTPYTTTTFGYMLQLTSIQTIKKLWSVQLRLRYNGKQEDVQGVIKPRYGVNLSVSKSMLKEKGRLSVSISDVFNTREWNSYSKDIAGYAYTSNNKWTTQQININFSYNFGKMNYDNQKRQKKNKNSGDDFNTGGDSAPK